MSDDSTDVAVSSYDHLDYDELTRIVLGEESIDSEFIEDVFQYTFKNVMKICATLGGAGRPEQAVEIDVLRFLLHNSMIGEDLRALFNAMDYKPSYIVLVFIVECERRSREGIRSGVFDSVRDGSLSELTEFFQNPLNSIVLVDSYNDFTTTNEADRFLPFVNDPLNTLVNQLSIDLGIFPSFKKIDFTQEQWAEMDISEGVSEKTLIRVSDIMHSFVINNTIVPRPAIGQVFVTPANPLYRPIAHTAMADDYQKLLEQSYSYLMEAMLRYSMTTDATQDTIFETLREYLTQCGFTPSLLVTLWHILDKNTKHLMLVVLTASLCGMESYKDMDEQAKNSYMVTLFDAIQTSLVAGTPMTAYAGTLVKQMPAEVILIGEFAGQHSIDHAEFSQEDLASSKDIALPKSMIN